MAFLRWRKVDLQIPELAERFALQNRVEGKSLNTVRWYNEAIDLFTRWLSNEGIPLTVSAMNEDIMRRWIVSLQDKPGRGNHVKASAQTVNNRVRSIRAFANWLYHQGHTSCHRLEKIKAPKFRKAEQEILTDEEIDRIRIAYDPRHFLGARNNAIFTLMLDTGLRVNEVVTLRYRDVHFDQRYVKVVGKGDRERVVPFGNACYQALAEYSRQRPEGCDREMFVQENGKVMGISALKSQTRRLAKLTGIERLHPHLLRHTYATIFLLAGGQAHLLQQNLGHTGLGMVMHYVHLSARQQAIAGQAFSPLDHLRSA